MTEKMTAAAEQEKVAPDNRRRWPALAVVLTGAFMILLDATIVQVAIAPIQEDLHAGYASVEWVISGYALAYGLLLIPAGRLGDRIGHKPVFMIGLAGFTITSALCGIASTPGQLVLYRVLQGVMAGVLNPPIIAVISSVFPPRERGKAFAWYGGVAGFSTALGPLLGGLLIAWDLGGWGWRPIFLVNIPVGVLALVAAVRLVPDSRGRGGSLDPVGIALVSAAMLLVTYPLVQGREAGWPLWMFVSLAAAAPVLACFAWWELRRVRRGTVPLVDVRLFANRSFTAGTGITLCYFAGFISLMFILSLYLQIGLGRSALSAGLALMSFAIGVPLGAGFSDGLAHRYGRRVLLQGSGLLIVGIVGVLATVRYVGADVTGWQLFPALLLGGIGSGLVIPTVTDLVLEGVPPQERGSGSGVLTAGQRLGQALGIAVVGVAMFGALGAHAGRSAATVTSDVRAQLVAAGLSGPAAQDAAAQFAHCFQRQLNAADPTATPHGCPRAQAGDPVGQVFARSAAAALRDDYTRAAQIAGLYTLGAVVLAFLLVFLLPRRGRNARSS